MAHQRTLLNAVQNMGKTLALAAACTLSVGCATGGPNLSSIDTGEGIFADNKRAHLRKDFTIAQQEQEWRRQEQEKLNEQRREQQRQKWLEAEKKRLDDQKALQDYKNSLKR